MFLPLTVFVVAVREEKWWNQRELPITVCECPRTKKWRHGKAVSAYNNIRTRWGFKLSSFLLYDDHFKSGIGFTFSQCTKQSSRAPCRNILFDTQFMYVWSFGMILVHLPTRSTKYPASNFDRLVRATGNSFLLKNWHSCIIAMCNFHLPSKRSLLSILLKNYASSSYLKFHLQLLWTSIELWLLISVAPGCVKDRPPLMLTCNNKNAVP